MSESSNPRRASLKNLNVQDKKRVANLIKELAKTGEERELALERLQEERVSFEEQLSAVQEEQATLKQERETLTQRLEKSENLLKKYESQLKDVKTEKEEQDKLLKKKFQVQPQSTQTSPLVQALGTDGTSNLKKGGIKARGGINAQNTQAYAGENESKENTGRMQWNKPQLPVYSNTLFDVKVSDAEHEQSSETQSIREEHQRSRVTDSSVLHELYLREYSMQLRLQEQQIEIQRQQVQLQQQLQLLQQQQQQQPSQQQQQQGQEQPGLFQQRQEEDNQQRQREIIQQHEDGSQRQHFNPKQRSQEEKERPHRKKLYPSKQENTFKEHSPKQTNFLQKRTPDRRDQQIEEVERLGSIPREHTVRSSRQRHDYDHHGHEMENSVHEHETARQQDIPHTPPGSPSPNHYHKTRSSPEYHKIKHNTDSTRYHYERHHVPKRKSPGNTHRINEATHVDINNNEYFQPRSPSQGQLKNRYDTNGDSMQERYLQEYLSDSNESYSETDSDAVHHHTSERACHCGYYHNHTRQQYDQPVLKRSHTKDTPHCDLKSTDNPDNKGGAQHQAPYANITVHQRLLHDVNRSQVRERQLPVRHHDHHIHKGEYRRLRDIHEKQSSQDDRGVPHYATHRHTREPPFEAAFYQPSKELISKHEPTGHPIHTQRQSGFSTSSLSAPKGVLTNNPPDRQEYFRPQINQDKSKDLLDDYIYNHRNAEHYDAKLDVGYGPRDKGNQQLTKRKISRKGHDRKQRAGGTVQSRYLPRTSTVGEQEGKCITLGTSIALSKSFRYNKYFSFSFQCRRESWIFAVQT